MTQDIRIEFRLHAQVNGQEFDMNGDGVGNATEGTCSLDLKADPGFPAGFDPVSCPSICSHPTSMFFARVVQEGADFAGLTGENYRVEPARRGLICDRQGKILLDLSVSGTVRKVRGRLLSEHRMWGTSELPRLALNRTPFDDYILPSAEGEATALVRFKLLTSRGEELDGMTVVPYRWNSGQSLDMPLVRRVEELEVSWDGGQRVRAYYRTSLRPLMVAELEAAGLAHASS